MWAECKTCGSLMDPSFKGEHCSLEPESWDESKLVKLDVLRTRSGLTALLAPMSFTERERFFAAPTTRSIILAMRAREPKPARRVVSSDTRKVYGHSLTTAEDARVHWRIKSRTVCGREARRVLNTVDQSAVTCKQCTFEP